MKVSGTIKCFSPEQLITTRDGRELKKRQIVIDAGYQSEQGENITQKFAAQTFKEFTDEQLSAWVATGQRLQFFLFFDVREYNGKYYQEVSLSNITEL